MNKSALKEKNCGLTASNASSHKSPLSAPASDILSAEQNQHTDASRVNVTQGVNIYLPWYIGDYLAHTPHLSTLEHGAYLLLHAAYWSSGSLPDNPAILQRITKLSKYQFGKVWPMLSGLFYVQDGLLRHQKLDTLAVDSQARKARSTKAATERWKPKTDATSIPQAFLEQCPSTSTSTSTPTKTSFSGGQSTQSQSGREKDNLDAVVSEVAARYNRSDAEVEGWLREHATRLSLLPSNPYPTARTFRRFADAKVRMPTGLLQSASSQSKKQKQFGKRPKESWTG